MARQTTVDTLNRLLAVHSRSLPQYLCSAHPWTTAKDSQAEHVLRQMADDHRLMVERIGSAILAEGQRPELGEFPMAFTGMHDLSIQYLIHEVAERQRQGLATIRQCVEQLQHAPAARALAEEALGAAEGHLQNLEELGEADLSVVSS